MKATSPTPEPSALLSKRDLARRWLCCIKTIERRIAEGDLHPIYIGRLVRFTREEVLAAERKMQK